MKLQTLFLAAAAAISFTCAANAAPSPRAALVERGRYLAEAVGGCGDCHSPRDQKGEVPAGKALTGTKLFFAPTVPMPVWADIAPPIAGLPAGYTEAQVATLLETGKRPNGSQPRPPMPAFRMHREDARAVAAYLASLKK